MSMPAQHINTDLTLDALLEGIAPAPALAVAGIASDSRKVTQGDVFFACQGLTHHGLQFAQQVADAGAIAIVYDATTATSVPELSGIECIGVADLAGRLGTIADRFYRSPSADVDVVGVTGTNGKSTVAWLLAQCYQGLGIRCAYSGTLGFGVDELDRGNDMTSPDVIENHRRVAEFRELGASHAAVEVSSHALDQQRFDAFRFDATLFTNLTRDHLDYHGDMRAYGEAKARLFTAFPARVRIINLDTEFGSELASRCREDVVTVSTRFDRVANGRPYVFVRSVVTRKNGSDVGIQTSWGNARVFVPLVGEFNVANAVLVIACLLNSGVELEDACDALAGVSAPPGRMQRVAATAGPNVYIDYAHTPNALEVAIKALRSHSRGRLKVVFGCGGDRDPGKRPMMGKVAERYADDVIITSDNPRTEPPGAIIDDVVAGLARPQAAMIIEDRAAAIAWGIAQAGDDDIILIAGKGHEDYQVVGDQRIDYSDYGVALGNLAAEASE